MAEQRNPWQISSILLLIAGVLMGVAVAVQAVQSGRVDWFLALIAALFFVLAMGARIGASRQRAARH